LGAFNLFKTEGYSQRMTKLFVKKDLLTGIF